MSTGAIDMKPLVLNMGNHRSFARTVAFLACACFCTLAFAGAPAQKAFGSAQEAVDALVAAAKAGDRATALTILGPDAAGYVSSGDAVADKSAREQFAEMYAQKHAVTLEGDSKATLTLGNDDFPFAYPLVKSANGWHFDTAAGNEELVARRVGENELSAINVMLAIVDAQRDYASADRNKDGVREYARKFASTPGKTDGLYWPTAAGEKPSPLGPLVVQAAGEGYKTSDKPQPYHGYFFHPLGSQGPDAKGGSMSYVVKGHMIGGFAALAYPAKYGNSGVMTFIVNHDGVVYEKDLGPNTAKLAPEIKRFDPGKGWKAVSPKS
jgi:hypothetical protein